jgi:recombination protein RecA
MYGEGISREGDLLDLAVEKRIVEKSGAWFAYGGERLGQGRENAKQFLKENPDVRRTIEERVRRELGLVREPEVATVLRTSNPSVRESLGSPSLPVAAAQPAFEFQPARRYVNRDG